MSSTASTSAYSRPGKHLHWLDLFLRADPWLLREWLLRRQFSVVSSCVCSILLGAGLYGAAIGSWRDPLQALYTGIKLPLVLLLTALGNGLLNGMLAPLLGLNLTFRQSLVLVLVSFAVASMVLGGFGPVAWFLVWNTPPLSGLTRPSSAEYAFLQLTLAVFVAFAGIIGNVRLFPLLRQWSDNKTVALKVLFAWLSVNLFLGSQIAWLLRPFIWEAGRPVEFIGPQNLRGSFYETIFEDVRRLLF
jgi:hypothetical protein